ncbi:unknown (plasmid) [Haloarcula marismortui ATCC 43049]|uniref:Uncharacterized protein n=1 Tax=Haloarcula marismortui (strain ATCC 43049 / DSM 3752 / JCM 8966 / VKM B-1809) TaxID=272569 RepID=Q5V7X9_HALMA|nr:hypothetical protein [Haloarcula marismortui]AAV44341.1 unknown [Haloarcula marismortui ATCC 43049]
MNSAMEGFVFVAVLIFLTFAYYLYTVYQDGYDPLALIKTGKLIER